MDQLKFGENEKFEMIYIYSFHNSAELRRKEYGQGEKKIKCGFYSTVFSTMCQGPNLSIQGYNIVRRKQITSPAELTFLVTIRNKLCNKLDFDYFLSQNKSQKNNLKEGDQ